MSHQVRRVNYKQMRSPILSHAPTSFSWVTKFCMLQLGSRQGMRCPTRVWWAIMQVRLKSQLQTHEIMPILAHAQQHYWELNIIVAWSLGSRQGMRCPTRVWWAIMQVRRVNYKHMITNTCMHQLGFHESPSCTLQLGSSQGMRCPTTVWWAIMQVRRVHYKHMITNTCVHTN